MKTILLGLVLCAALAFVGGASATASGELFGDATVVAGGGTGFAAELRSDASGVGYGGVNVTPTTGWHSTGNLIGNEDAGRYDFSQFGGSPFTPYSAASASVQAGKVVEASIVVDASWNATATGGDSEQTVLVDDTTLNGDVVTFDCSFTTSGSTMTLDGDCQTDHTILVPNGFTLDGDGHAITAVDPAGGHFVGGVLANGRATANVTNVTVTASGLADICDGGNDRLRGILFDGAAGSITHTEVVDVRQGAHSG